ncbi:MAG: hypothetical protein Q9223_000831 [Gallowayella weberi]
MPDVADQLLQLLNAVRTTGMAMLPSALQVAAPPTPTNGGGLFPTKAMVLNVGPGTNVSASASHLPHCQQPDPPSPPTPALQPPNRISSTPLTPNQVYNAFSQIPLSNLIETLSSLGENTAGRSQADLVNAANARFEASMGNLDLGQVDAAASFANFEAGQDFWTYYADRGATAT